MRTRITPRRWALWGAMLLALLGASVLVAKTTPGASSALKAALKAIKNKDNAAAKTATQDALVRLRERGPLTIRQAEIVGQPPLGLGLYEPVVGGVVPKNRLVLIYLEVEGFLAQGQDKKNVSLTVKGDFSFEDGSALGERELGTRRYVTRAHQSLDAFGLDLQLSDKAPAGRYSIVLRVSDDIGKKKAQKTVDFVLTEP